jgi:mannose-6-phosphate isomerase class I
MRTHKLKLIGELVKSGLPDFPLCVKFLDTTEPLSVQVHPSDERIALNRLQSSSEDDRGLHESIARVADEFEVPQSEVSRIARSIGITMANQRRGLTDAEQFMLRAMVKRRVATGSKPALVMRGKSECWIVLDAARDAVIYQGLREGVRPHDFELALDGGEPAELMNARAVKPGDFLYNQAGMIHAIGGGVALLEIQQNCPTTYRLWDFPRAEKREMHINEGLGAARFNLPLPPIQPTHRDEEVLAPLGPFGVRSLRIAKASRDLKYGPGFTVHTCLQGECEITSHARDKLEPTILKRGETVLWPAVFDKFEYFPRGDCWIIQSWARE